MRPKETLKRFDAYLAARHLSLDAVVVGGAALGLLGVITRETRDCDILHPDLPEAIRLAAIDFAAQTRARGEPLDDGWLNNGPSSLVNLLPAGWMDRTEIVFAGTALTLRCPGRLELLMSKVFALCDRGIDLADCVALAPAPEELEAIAPWLSDQDANPEWPAHVRATLDDLDQRVSRGV